MIKNTRTYTAPAGAALLAALAALVAQADTPAARPQELQCLLEPSMEVEVGTAVSGVIENILVDRGDTVRKGEVLATLQSGTERAAVNLARARVEFGLRKEERNAELYRDELISLGEKDEVATERQLAELEMRSAQAQLELRTIHSPIDGVVVERFVSPGEFVADARVVRLVRIDPLYVEVIAPLGLLGTVAIGTDAKVIPSAPNQQGYSARVTVVDPVIDAASGTFGVRLQLPNPGHRIAAGLRCDIAFDVPAAESAAGATAAAATAAGAAATVAGQ